MSEEEQERYEERTATEVALMQAEEQRREAAIRADEREKDIEALERADDILRRERFISPEIIMALGRLREPKTREGVLEEALRKISELGPYSIPFDDSTTPQWIARRALEWKP